MNPENTPVRLLAFIVAVVVVVVALVLAWNLGTKTDGALPRTPAIEPKLAAQPSQLEKYEPQPALRPPTQPLAATQQQSSPPPAEPLAKTQQPAPQAPPSEPLAQAQNPMQGQPLQSQPYQPLTDQLFIQIAAEIALTQSGQPVLPQDTMGLATAAARILEKYHVDPMAYYQKAIEVSQGPRSEWYSQQIWARVAQLRRQRPAPQPPAAAPLPAQRPPQTKKGR